jgi:ferredoxin
MTHKSFNASSLKDSGLNLIHIFDRDQLPIELVEALNQASGLSFTQVILVGHGGRRLWEASRDYRLDSNRTHPIDEFSVEQFKSVMAEHHHDVIYKILYPNHTPPFHHFNLQSFGEIAGWHNSSPFKVGINSLYGTWFAYRLLVVSESQFKITNPFQLDNPCASCKDKPCITHCPVTAVSVEDYDWRKCFDYRKTERSQCGDRCLARLACPVAKEHQYSEEQIQYHYSLSRRHL